MPRKSVSTALIVTAVVLSTTLIACGQKNEQTLLPTSIICEMEEKRQLNTVAETESEVVTEMVTTIVRTTTSHTMITTCETTTTTSEITMTTSDTTTAMSETTTTMTIPRPEPIELSIYLHMDISKTTGMPKFQFVELMEELGCDYEGYFSRNAVYIWELCQEYSINELAFCGIIALESGWAQYPGGDNNYFGIVGASYSSEQEGLESFACLLGNQYLSPDGSYYKGVTLEDVGDTYCELGGEYWSGKVYGCMLYLI